MEQTKVIAYTRKNKIIFWVFSFLLLPSFVYFNKEDFVQTIYITLFCAFINYLYVYKYIFGFDIYIMPVRVLKRGEYDILRLIILVFVIYINLNFLLL